MTSEATETAAEPRTTGTTAEPGTAGTAAEPEGTAPLALFGPDFAADPEGHYRQLRQAGPLAPVLVAPGIEAMLVTDYQAALDLLRDTHTFSKDSRAWQAGVPADSPVLPMLSYRPTALFSDGETHTRYRQAITDSLAAIEPHLLQAQVTRIAERLLASFAGDGSADLIDQYARRLPQYVFNAWYGVPDEDSERLVAGIAGMFNSKQNAATAYGDLVAVITSLVEERRRNPRQDLTSHFLSHPAGLDNDEAVRQITLTISGGNEPTSNLISNTLLHMLTDTRYASDVYGGSMTAHEAVNDVLWQHPPIANFAAHYPRYDTTFHGVPLRAGQLVLVSFAAANAPLAPTVDSGLLGSGTRAHLAWSAGPHSCPARQPALLLAITAIERLTSQLSDMRLAVRPDELVWRPGPFHRALTHLPVHFTPLHREIPASGTVTGGVPGR